MPPAFPFCPQLRGQQPKKAQHRMKETNTIETLDLKLLKNSVLFRIKTHCMGNERKFKLSEKAVEAIAGKESQASNLPADATEDQKMEAERMKKAAERLRGSKKLINVKEFDAINSFLAKFGQRIKDKYVNPSFIDEGLYAVKREAVPALVEEIGLAQTELEKNLVPALVKAYAAEVLEARKILNGAFNPADYPTEASLPSKFGIDYRIVNLGVPEGLPPEIREQEEAKLKKSFEDAAAAINRILYTGFAEIIDHMVDRLTPAAEGARKKTFEYTTIENFLEFIESFKNKNVFDDGTLAGMVAKAKDILETVGQKPKDMANRLRDYQGLRERVRKEFETVKTELDKTIQELPERSIDLSEE